jgi:hypothetical protein
MMYMKILHLQRWFDQEQYRRSLQKNELLKYHEIIVGMRLYNIIIMYIVS